MVCGRMRRVGGLMRIAGRHDFGVCASVFAVLARMAGGGLAFSQEPIHVAVNLVNVAFSVRDARGTLIDSLGKEDVEIFEDAIPQKISFFARSTDVPLILGLIVDVRGS